MPPFIRSTRRLSEHARLLQHVRSIQERCDRALPWEPDTVGLPESDSESALARINDVAFYAHARDEVSTLARICAHLLQLHHPDEGEYCANCRLPWPCPTFDEMAHLLG